MKTRLDQEIEKLGSIVEKCLDLCNATWNGVRCTLPANHEPKERHKFPVEFRQALTLLGGGGISIDQLQPEE